ncbi:MAG TPA: hypothetical protein VKV19_06530 [Ktedonobacteraceae bacterium]|jgi:hypothetical protein|nr:hypothetical protein [Ktedonobacteraceae bacterium]
MRLGRFGAATVLGLLLGLVVFTTGAFAQTAEKMNSDRGNINVLAHVATTTAIKEGGCVGSGCYRAYGLRAHHAFIGRRAVVRRSFVGDRGFGIGGFGGWGFAGSSFGGFGFGGCNGFFFIGCDGFGGVRFRRATIVVTRTRSIRECSLNSFWGRACRSLRVTERRSVSRSEFRGGFGGFDGAFAVKVHH